MSPITTHILDTAKGCPAQNVPVTLERLDGRGEWQWLAGGQTNADGRITDLLTSKEFTVGKYRLTFDTVAYQGVDAFFPAVAVVFQIKAAGQHYHVPLLLSPFGYSTYRGS